jgi:two-component system, NtrC family, sensor kinase
MLRTKLFKGFAAVVLLFALLSSIVGVRTIQQRVMQETQARVRLDLSSGRAVFNARMQSIQTIVSMAATKRTLVDHAVDGTWDDAELRNRLERIRVRFGLDFLSVLDADGCVVLRTTPPYATGDYRSTDPAVVSALKGQAMACMTLLSGPDLEREAVGLAERAYMELEDTPRARRTPRTEETRGMVMVAAAPVSDANRVIGIVYGGVLVNRNFDLIDRIHDVVYGDELYGDSPLGTATLFLYDSRIATTVRSSNGNRAIGTRVSKEVADRVLDNGEPWIGEAFVVRGWYLTAYEPIRDGAGTIIGMLYVGILKEPFVAYGRSLIWRYLFLTLFVMAVALWVAYLLAGRLTAPIHRLVEASNRTREGARCGHVSTAGTCEETHILIEAFNGMTTTLAEREERLRQLNHSYMETLGFVSHELKSPVASIMNYVYLMREGRMGPLTEQQARALRAIDNGSRRLVEMVRHYLNLARIENREMAPHPVRVAVRTEVIDPLLEGMETALQETGMRVENGIGPEIAVRADINMVREVFENVVGNAVKYGREGGRIDLAAERDGDWVRFRVRNEGDGIPQDRMGQLFQKFNRLHGTKGAKRQKGTGLGLFISRHIVEAHGGEIRAASEPGVWAEFTFTLPAETESAGDEEQA